MASTAWVNKTSNEMGRIQQTFDLAIAGASQGFTTVINAIKVRSKNLVGGLMEALGSNGQYISFGFNASAVTGTNLDIALYGCDNSAGTDKYLLLDALVPDITATGKVVGIIDIQQYPAPFYFISVTGDNAETGNTLAITISGDLGGSQS
jgi:hypothetical protein